MIDCAVISRNLPDHGSVKLRGGGQFPHRNNYLRCALLELQALQFLVNHKNVNGLILPRV
jgi:hypothetical protein